MTGLEREVKLLNHFHYCAVFRDNQALPTLKTNPSLKQETHKLYVRFSSADLKKINLENFFESSNSLTMKFIQDRQLAVRNRRLAQPRIILGDFSSNHLNELIVQNCKKILREFLIRNAQKICFIFTFVC